jgi:tripartite-type tricarboxylate transporter receptor subunit TctC
MSAAALPGSNAGKVFFESPLSFKEREMPGLMETMGRVLRLRAAPLALGAVLLPLVAGQASAQAWPQKPIRVIIGYAAAGTPDIAIRVLAPKMSENLGQPMVVENRPGAGASTAMEVAARAPADGYTLAVGTLGSLLLSKALFPNAAFDPITSFDPIGVFAKVSFVVASHSSLPARNLKEFLALAKAQPGKLNYGSSTPGSPPHILAEMFKAQAGVDIVGVTFKGSADAATAFLAGNVQMMVDAMPTIGPLVSANKAIPLLVTSSVRRKDLPDVPTAIEAGMPDYQVDSWLGLVAPAGTPDPVLRRLNNEIVKAMAVKQIADGIIKIGLDPTSNTIEQFRAIIKTDWPKFQAVVKASGADSK